MKKLDRETLKKALRIAKRLNALRPSCGADERYRQEAVEALEYLLDEEDTPSQEGETK